MIKPTHSNHYTLISSLFHYLFFITVTNPIKEKKSWEWREEYHAHYFFQNHNMESKHILIIHYERKWCYPQDVSLWPKISLSFNSPYTRQGYSLNKQLRLSIAQQLLHFMILSEYEIEPSPTVGQKRKTCLNTIQFFSHIC